MALLFAALAMFPSPSSCAPDPGDPDPHNAVLRAEFERRYTAWRGTEKFTALSDVTKLAEIESFHEIVLLGPSAIPFMIERIEESRRMSDPFGHILHIAVRRITKASFPPAADVVSWWKSRGDLPARFEKHYTNWKQARAKGPLVLQTEQHVYNDSTKRIERKLTETELGQAYKALRDLGIDALPLIVEKVKAGDLDLLPLFDELTDGIGHTYVGTLQERAKFTLNWWEANKKDWLVPPVSAAKLKDDKR
jgi:hypothetical protein